ncbi:MAG: hypothetical protein OIN83_06360 [Candidatus Methanoperedens sp.]|nr:hypothetical protein [Candidatus Methanoperedens sp.]
MNNKTIMVVAAIIVVLGAGYAVARPESTDSRGSMMDGFGSGIWNRMMGYSNGGMMGGNGPGNGMMGYGNGGMMGGNGPGNGMMGYSNGGMMGGNGAGNGYCGSATGYTDRVDGVNATPITIGEAKESVQQYLATTGNPDLKLSEIIEFDTDFYAGVKEQSTGIYAFELLVNKYTGAVFPEMGPNMMWNTKYGHMNRNTPAQTSINEERALTNAQDYLDKALPGTKVGDSDAFYGYYTIEVQKDHKIYGMLSVNSNTGAVWYHNWHGDFVKILEVG